MMPKFAGKKIIVSDHHLTRDFSTLLLYNFQDRAGDFYMPKKRGLPQALEIDDIDEITEQSAEEFAKDFFPDGSAQPQNGMPSLESLKQTYKTKSACIRYLINRGFKVNEIAKHLGCRYQMVRNVATTILKRGPNEDWRAPADRQPPKLNGEE